MDDSVPEECFATHISFFVAWMVKNDLWKGLQGIDSGIDVARLKSGEITGFDFLNSQCGGKLFSDFFTEEGEKFSIHHYHQYCSDYSNLFQVSEDPVRPIAYTPENFSRMEAVLDMRFSEWKNLLNRKSWWKILLQAILKTSRR